MINRRFKPHKTSRIRIFLQICLLNTVSYKFSVKRWQGLNDIIDRCRDIIQHELCHDACSHVSYSIVFTLCCNRHSMCYKDQTNNGISLPLLPLGSPHTIHRANSNIYAMLFVKTIGAML